MTGRARKRVFSGRYKQRQAMASKKPLEAAVIPIETTGYMRILYGNVVISWGARGHDAGAAVAGVEQGQREK